MYHIELILSSPQYRHRLGAGLKPAPTSHSQAYALRRQGEPPLQPIRMRHVLRRDPAGAGSTYPRSTGVGRGGFETRPSGVRGNRRP